MIKSILGKTPAVDKTAFVAETATVIGGVTLGKNTSVWFGAVIRADLCGITVGDNSNVQDNCTLHVDPDRPLKIGNGVTVGHNAVVHGATIEDDVLIGMNSTVLNGAVVGAGSIIGAGALVPENAVIPPRSVAVGVPARVVRQVTDADLAAIRLNANGYVQAARVYAAEIKQ